GKAAVIGWLARRGEDGHSTVRLSVVADRKKGHVQAEVRKHVEPGASLHADELKAYEGLAPDYAHNVINHAEACVRGNVLANGLENFWSLLKRTIKGTYVSVEPFH